MRTGIFGFLLVSLASCLDIEQAQLPPPPTGEAIGLSGWTILHAVTMAYPEAPSLEQKNTMSNFFTYFAKVYPCAMCSTHFQAELQQDPPKTESKAELTQWLCRVHNRVNARLGKPEFPCAKIYARWDASTALVTNINNGIA